MEPTPAPEIGDGCFVFDSLGTPRTSFVAPNPPVIPENCAFILRFPPQSSRRRPVIMQGRVSGIMYRCCYVKDRWYQIIQ
ncbi:hypothetical protein CEXT_636781 [Caerostris extrusa]|uniref:Uncharacterized protein n=1 Tax=Caerostris extrusa TaxID=172846 RepID=A0AAV4Y5J8_CAEEX|nr:hypothetical protein CEXT_636781 [Caerostris extrusa]